jgi:uncharacterized protein YabN with tetrapyrrole methylase and pyrophosphatase domain
VGFDWPDIAGVLEKLEEEIRELKQYLSKLPEPIGEEETGGSTVLHGTLPSRLEGELGDVFFVLVNLARFLSLDPESALKKTNRKFRRRFQWMERQLENAGRSPRQASIEELESLWQQAKRQEQPEG